MPDKFVPISLKPEGQQSGLVWSGMVDDKHLAELQTGVIPQLVHLILFDTENSNAVVYDRVQAFELGTSFDDEAEAELEAAIAEALATL